MDAFVSTRSQLQRPFMNHLKFSFFLAAIFLTSFAYAQSPLPKNSPPTGDSPSAAKPAASPSGTPAAPPTIASAIDREVSIIEKEIVEAAEAMPADKFDFSPEKMNLPGSDFKGVRTFGQQIKHVAASNYAIWSPITGEKPPDN